MRSRILLPLFILICLAAPALASENPFRPQSRQSHTVASPQQRVILGINKCQMQLKQKMSSLTRSENHSKILILLICFAYGVVHAAGPGHGKAIVFSYLMSSDTSICRGIFTGAAAAFCHGLSAIVIVLGIRLLSAGRVVSTFNSVSSNLVTISYSLIIAIGIIMLVTRLINMRNGNATSKKTTGAMVLSLGLSPCPGAMIILLYFLAQDMVLLGITGALFMSTGMALTVSVFGLAGMGTRKIALKKGDSARTARNILETAGAILIIMIGSFLLAASL